MKNQKSPTDKQRVEVILIVPLGVEEVIFKWGVHSVCEYLKKTCDPVNIQVWDFSGDDYFAELHKRYGKTLSTLFLSLKSEQMNTLFATTSNPDIFLGAAACTGGNFFAVTGLRRWFRRACAGDLAALKKEVSEYITAKITEYIDSSPDAHRIWAFSVYDRTLFNSIFISRLIRKSDFESTIIFGGDYFNFPSAEKTFKNAPFVDGIVVGYGEEVMRQVVSERQKVGSISDLRLKGLVNNGYFRGRDESGALDVVNVPPFYEELPHKPAFAYVRLNDAGEIRVLAQRGCSWGHCDFCTQIDKNMYFPVSVDHLLEDVQTAVEKVKSTVKGNTVKISFDSDENSIDMIVRFIDYLNGLKDPGVNFDISLWFQVKSYRKELVEALAKIDSKKVHVHFMYNFESLNFDTLRRMRKGHSPLQAIEGAKAIQDCGHSYVTNYFIHYPLETGESIVHEVDVLKRILHLMMPPDGGGIFAHYGSNNRDTVYHNPDKYKVKIRRLRGDKWLNNVFEIDLPFSMWAYTYDEKPSFSLERLLLWSYYKTIKARDAVYRPRRTAESNWGESRIPFNERIGIFSRRLKSFLWKTLHNSLTLFGKGKAFRHRTRLVMYLSKILEAGTPTSVSEGSAERICKLNARIAAGKANVIQSHFYIEDGYLKKEYNGPGKKEKWSLELPGSELKILRYLYWSRKRKDVIDAFKDEMDTTDTEEIIDRHIQLGSLVQFRGLLLSVVNDRGYWK